MHLFAEHSQLQRIRKSRIEQAQRQHEARLRVDEQRYGVLGAGHSSQRNRSNDLHVYCHGKHEQFAPHSEDQHRRTKLHRVAGGSAVTHAASQQQHCLDTRAIQTWIEDTVKANWEK
jgi:hypothetical protein